MSTQEAASAAKERYSTRLLQRPEVSGVGTARHGGDWVIEVHVDPSAAADLSDLPSELDGVAVAIVPDGPYRAGPATSPAT
jgi:hypothetical protein